MIVAGSVLSEERLKLMWEAVIMSERDMTKREGYMYEEYVQRIKSVSESSADKSSKLDFLYLGKAMLSQRKLSRHQPQIRMTPFFHE